MRLAVAIWAIRFNFPAERSLPVYLGGVLGLAHMLSTAKAALINITRWREGIDDATLAKILQRFKRWQAVRATLQFLTFVIAV